MINNADWENVVGSCMRWISLLGPHSTRIGSSLPFSLLSTIAPFYLLLLLFTYKGQVQIRHEPQFWHLITINLSFLTNAGFGQPIKWLFHSDVWRYTGTCRKSAFRLLLLQKVVFMQFNFTWSEITFKRITRERRGLMKGGKQKTFPPDLAAQCCRSQTSLYTCSNCITKDVNCKIGRNEVKTYWSSSDKLVCSQTNKWQEVQELQCAGCQQVCTATSDPVALAPEHGHRYYSEFSTNLQAIWK